MDVVKKKGEKRPTKLCLEKGRRKKTNHSLMLLLVNLSRRKGEGKGTSPPTGRLREKRRDFFSRRLHKGEKKKRNRPTRAEKKGEGSWSMVPPSIRKEERGGKKKKKGGNRKLKVRTKEEKKKGEKTD